MRSAVVMLACLLGVVVIAGCGGGGARIEEPLSKHAYEREMRALARNLESTLDKFGEAFDDPSELGQEFNAVADLLEETSRDLDEIQPPEDVTEQHKVMVESSSAAARRFIGLAESGSLADVLALMETSELDDLTRAARQIRAKGYDIGGGW